MLKAGQNAAQQKRGPHEQRSNLRAPGAIPRGCYTTYRGNLAADPREINQENATYAAARIAVNMTAPDVPTEEREKLTDRARAGLLPLHVRL